MSTVTEIWTGRQGSFDYKRRRTYTRVFRVLTDDQTDGPIEVVAEAGLPSLGAAYTNGSETDLLSRLVKITPVQSQEDPYEWQVTCEYDSQLDLPEGIDPDTFPENPLSRPAIWEFDYKESSIAVTEDLDGTAIKNSAGQPYDPPLEIPWALPTIRITKNKSSFSYPYVSQLQEACNDAAWNGFDQYTVKVESVKASFKWENNVAFWELQYLLVVDHRGWLYTRVLDSGYYESIPASSGSPATLKLIRDAYGTPMSAASLLDGAGRRLATSGVPYYNQFRLRRAVSFAAIP